MRKPYVRRSGRWPALKNKHLKAHPTCEVCGRKGELNVHHKIPVHIDPSKELDPGNLITLCEGKTMNCHLWCGHLGYWPSFNLSVVKDAAYLLNRFLTRPKVYIP